MNLGSLSIVVLTKDRREDLSRLLYSLCNQTVPPNELIIISNGNKIETKLIVNKYRGQASFDIKLFHLKNNNIPTLRNLGLSKSTSEWILYIDDDCVPVLTLVEEYLNNISKNKNIDVYLGKCGIQDINNIYSLTNLLRDRLWKYSRIILNNITDLEILDTKNVLYNQNFLNKHNLTFSDEINKNMMGRSEDCDMGMKIEKSGGKASYCKKALVIHKDPISFKEYFDKLSINFISHIEYEKKWQKFRKNKKYFGYSLMYIINKFKNEYKLNLFKLSLILFLLILSGFYVKWLRFISNYFRKKSDKLLIVSSGGGHISQVMLLKPWWSKYDRVFVTSKQQDTDYYLQNENVYYANFPETANILNAFKNTLLAIKIIVKVRPTLVFSMGAGVAPPFFLISVISGIKNLFIEMYEFKSSMSLTGKMAYYLGVQVIVQHKQLLKKYPKAIYKGSLI